jgi:hypothetical protein
LRSQILEQYKSANEVIDEYNVILQAATRPEKSCLPDDTPVCNPVGDFSDKELLALSESENVLGCGAACLATAVANLKLFGDGKYIQHQHHPTRLTHQTEMFL